jgi:hypothetical protein
VKNISGKYKNLNSVGKRAKEILKNGELLQVTENLAFKKANNYDFAQRIGREIALIFAGQAIKHLDIGQKDRAYSHCGLFAPPGMGKDFAYDLMVDSGIFPKDIFRIDRLDNITRAALEGTIHKNKLVPPPTITKDIISTTEWASLASGQAGMDLLSDLRVMWEKGVYTRQLAKIGELDEILQTASEEVVAYVGRQIAKYEKLGMHIDEEDCRITIKTTTSWIIASADFGAQTKFGKSLLSLGDLNRIRWRSYLPDREERIKTISAVGSLPPISISDLEEKACNEAWRATIIELKKAYSEGISVSRDQQSYYERQQIWNELVKEMLDAYPELKKKENFDQIMSLRTTSEFRRIMYQHAALKQFARSSGNDLSISEKFQIDYKEDGEFAKRLWLEEYVPGMIDVISNVSSSNAKPAKRCTKTKIGMDLVLERLEKGPAKREELLVLIEKNGISSYLLDNKILPRLIKFKLIVKDSQGWYSLKKDGRKKE